jgi:hypothetical protein
MPGRALVVLSVLLVVPCSIAQAQSPLSPSGPAATVTSPATHPPPPPPPPGRAPERCGQTWENADYGELGVGSLVTLQRHRMVRGDDNWDPQMDRFLGRAAHVAQLRGVDEQGCPGVHVDVDGGLYFWRVRDLGIGTGLQPLPPAIEASSAFPQSCHQAAANYGAATIGAMVVLGRHRPVDGDTNWADEMGQWVGQCAHVVAYGDLDTEGCPGVRVDVDGQAWFWRVRDLQSVSDPSMCASGGGYSPSLGVTTDHGRPATSVGAGIFGSGGAPGPQACGLTDQQIVWDPIALGAQVTLGRHRDVNGDANWDVAMDPYVGTSAHITQLVGVDEQGCPVVRVDVDAGSYYWRVRDMTVTSGGTGTGTTPGWSGVVTWPTACGMSATTVTYGPVQIGSRIVLGTHSPWTGPDSAGGYVTSDTNWADEMAQWVGMVATVAELDGVDDAGCAVVHVDIDGGQYYWRLRDAQPAP